MIDDMKCFGNDNLGSGVKKADKVPFGIDLGTTNSAISVGLGTEGSKIITLANGKHTMPSVVAWRGGDNFIVGQEAYDMDPDNSVVRSVKRMMQDADAAVVFQFNGEERVMSPAEVSAEILKGLVAQTGGIYGEVKDIVVTVPAYFNQTGIENTKKACELAGLNCIHIMREPTAAALNYRLDKNEANVQYALVYDLGGGTFDISLIRISERSSLNKLYRIYGIEPPEDDHSNRKLIEPQAIDGDGHLGGDDYDDELYKELIRILGDTLRDKYPTKNYDLSTITSLDRKRLTKKVCNAKTDVYATHCLSVDVVLADGSHVDEVVRMSYQNFYNAFLPIYTRTKKKTNNVLRECDCDVDTIILMGGSTKNPILVDMLSRDFPGFRINRTLDPDESVAKGAGIRARDFMYGDTSVQIFDILPQSIGILSGDTVLPLIRKNSQRPMLAESMFTTTQDNQEHVDIRIFQGNSMYPEECIELGKIVIDGIEKAPKGVPDLAIQLSVNTDCLLTCKAAINGVYKEKKLSLNAVSDKGNSTQEDKWVLRWKKVINRLPEDEQGKLLDMISGYPSVYSAKDIGNALRQFTGPKLRTIDDCG